MKYSRPKILKSIVFAFYLFVVNQVVAQTTDTTKFSGQTSDDKTRINPELYSPILQPKLFNQKEFIIPTLNFNKNNPLFFKPEQTRYLNRISFTQNKELNLFPNLGGYEHFNNNFNYNIGNSATINLGLGFLKQNSILNSYQPNYQFSFYTSLEYALNEWLSTYFYGQYITPAINNTNPKLDPLIQMNPIFFQTEMGGGLRAKYKNIKTDVGMKNIYDTQFNQSNPVQFMDTKVTIGF